MEQKGRSGFGTKLGVVLATAGSAVGLGNIWRFPYLVGENGGAAFIFIYIVCILMLGIPCMLCEFIVGRRAGTNAVRAYRKLANGTPWMLVGYVGVITGVMIMSFYSVVSGWCAHYVFASVTGDLQGESQYFTDYFAAVVGNPIVPVLWAVAMIVTTHFIVERGVKNGIEKASILLMPTLFILLLVIVVCSCTLPGAKDGIAFLLNPDFSKVTGDTLLTVLGQVFFSLSIGVGVLCTYASYFKKSIRLTRSALQICVIDLIIAILSGMMVFPAAFAVGVRPDAGPSLIFITLPNVFQHAFGHIPFLAGIISVVFYILLTLAALTTLISLHELATAYLHEEHKISRRKAAWIVTAGCSVIGALCSLSFGGYDWLQLAGKSLFDWFDFITGQVLLPIGGLLVTLFVCWYMSRDAVRDEYSNGDRLRMRDFSLFYFCAKYICPLCIVLIFLKGLGWL